MERALRPEGRRSPEADSFDPKILELYFWGIWGVDTGRINRKKREDCLPVLFFYCFCLFGADRSIFAAGMDIPQYKGLSAFLFAGLGHYGRLGSFV